MVASPVFSIVVPVYNTDHAMLRAAVDSVLRQTFEDWELILVDDASTREGLAEVLDELEASDPRVIVVRRETNGGISLASNDALAVACGDFMALLDHDDLLAAGALRAVADAIEADDRIDYIYTDEEKVDEEGRLYDAFAKPDWSPERLRGQMYLGHLSVMRRSIVDEVGGFRPEFDGSQDHDLALRVTERSRVVHHIPLSLYRWRAHAESTASSSDAKTYTWDAGVRAVQGQLDRLGIRATARRAGWPNCIAVDHVLDPETRISIVIPTRGSSGTVFGHRRVFVLEAVRSILAHADHENLEIIVVYDVDGTPSDVLRRLAHMSKRVRLVPYAQAFNFSEKCNIGVSESTGDVIVLCNDDIQLMPGGSLRALVGPLAEREIGMVGAYLLYEDGHVQHAGHQYSEGGFRHALTGWRDGDAGPFAALQIDREVSGVTAALAAMRRDDYIAVGGLSEDLPVNFNDVDLCMKVRGAGFRIVWAHQARAYHFESRTRERTVEATEVATLRRRWGRPQVDAYVKPTPDLRGLGVPEYPTANQAPRRSPLG